MFRFHKNGFETNLFKRFIMPKIKIWKDGIKFWLIILTSIINKTFCHSYTIYCTIITILIVFKDNEQTF